MTFSIQEKLLHFKQPAGTSRGVYTTRKIWLLTVEHDGRTAIGECAPLPQLSCDDIPDYEAVLRRFCDIIEATGSIPYDEMRNYPSMLFGVETALAQLSRTDGLLYDTPFSHGEEGIPINGLVWMGTHDEMLSRLKEKLALGFRCVKLKIGAIDFAKELDLIQHIRKHFSREEVELRVDANGGFTPDVALERLQELARYDIHSIEQPIMAHQWSEMAQLCQLSPLPIALDEELIGVNSTDEKIRLLDTIKPQYIILKPSLHGGVAGTREWIALANERGIGSWITSALESNIGLNAIAQLAANIYGSKITMPQGLGTGMLFTDNIPMPLEIRNDCLWITKRS
ncbi:MAG: o-succinylbenzoate synthase [Bacteroidales bacterium]|nr:o-succinylbenzoate synthase [Bacteroidales bacterium]MCI7033226.1 o-succinylbenzoate synthase [Bacteroidales bacterium]